MRGAHRVQRFEGDVHAGSRSPAGAWDRLHSARSRVHGLDLLQDPNGLKVELACYKFEPPEGFRAADVLMQAHALRVDRGDHHITDEHVADAIELLLAARPRLS